MSIQTQLDALREALPDCRLTAFGDMASLLVLRSSSAIPCPRETLDRLVQRIATTGSQVASVDPSTSADASLYGRTFALFTANETVVCARGSEEEVSCAVLDPAQDIDAALHKTADSVASITESGK